MPATPAVCRSQAEDIAAPAAAFDMLQIPSPKADEAVEIAQATPSESVQPAAAAQAAREPRTEAAPSVPDLPPAATPTAFFSDTNFDAATAQLGVKAQAASHAPEKKTDFAPPPKRRFARNETFALSETAGETAAERGLVSVPDSRAEPEKLVDTFAEDAAEPARRRQAGVTALPSDQVALQSESAAMTRSAPAALPASPHVPASATAAAPQIAQASATRGSQQSAPVASLDAAAEARASRDYRQSESIYRQIAQGPPSPQASAAQFRLAELLQDTLNQPAAARAAWEQCLQPRYARYLTVQQQVEARNRLQSLTSPAVRSQ